MLIFSDSQTLTLLALILRHVTLAPAISSIIFS